MITIDWLLNWFGDNMLSIEYWGEWIYLREFDGIETHKQRLCRVEDLSLTEEELINRIKLIEVCYSVSPNSFKVAYPIVESRQFWISLITLTFSAIKIDFNEAYAEKPNSVYRELFIAGSDNQIATYKLGINFAKFSKRI